MKEIKQKPAGGKPKTADAARVPKAVVKAAWLQAREAARAGEKQVVGGKDGAYSGAADTGEKGADKLVSTGERVTELAYRGGRKLAERSAGQRRERAKAAQTGGEAAQRHGAGETIAHAGCGARRAGGRRYAHPAFPVQLPPAGALSDPVLFAGSRRGAYHHGIRASLHSISARVRAYAFGSGAGKRLQCAVGRR